MFVDLSEEKHNMRMIYDFIYYRLRKINITNKKANKPLTMFIAVF